MKKMDLDRQLKIMSMLLLMVVAVSCGGDEDPEKSNDKEDDIEAPAVTNLVIARAGTYSVTSTDNGTHARSTVILGSDGSIDFDTSVSFGVADIVAVSNCLLYAFTCSGQLRCR